VRDMNMVAIGRVVLTSREHIIAFKGFVGTLLGYPTKSETKKNTSTRSRT
jgi:non-homologous end joining protein Ku